MSANDTMVLSQLRWNFTLYKFNTTKVAERTIYLSNLTYNNTPCEEDANLPEDLKNAYLKNG